jgi:hypothetical protein
MNKMSLLTPNKLVYQQRFSIKKHYFQIFINCLQYLSAVQIENCDETTSLPVSMLAKSAW